jgi:hypothetical protein
MKKLFLSFTLLFCTHITPSNQAELTIAEDKDLELLQQALEIVASMSDNIANLAIQHKTKINSPEMTKQEAIALIEKITGLVIIVIKKARLKKNPTKKIFLYTQEELSEIIEQIADEILEKVQ